MQKKSTTKLQLSLIAIAIVVMVIAWTGFSNDNRFIITFVNVGQGDGALVSTPGGRHILIDAGPQESKNNIGSTMLDYITMNSIGKVDIIIMSHFHDDHVGALQGILSVAGTELILMPTPLSEVERTIASEIAGYAPATTMVRYMKEGESVELGENISISAVFQQQTSDENDKSLINILKYYDSKILFTGDITTNTEALILEKVPKKDLDCDIIKVAHHGSKYASSEEFYQAVTPQYAVISVGKNSYGHPTDEALNRIDRYSDEILRTDELGSISFVIDKNGIKRESSDNWWNKIFSF